MGDGLMGDGLATASNTLYHTHMTADSARDEFYEVANFFCGKRNANFMSPPEKAKTLEKGNTAIAGALLGRRGLRWYAVTF